MKSTYFAPPEKTERRKFKNQIESISQSVLMNTLLNTMAGLLVILNEDRQIVALNHSFLNLLGIKDPEVALGLRLGESLKCIHSHEQPAGCGTTPHCITCGAVIAMMTAIKENKPDEQICAITIEQNGFLENLCLIVRAQPLTIDGNRWILIFVQDITQQHFWINLEHVFFHDIRNILGSLIGSAEMLELEMPDNSLVHGIMKSSLRIKEEITLQNILSNEKKAADYFRKACASLADIREDLEIIVARNPAWEKINLQISWPEENVTLHTVSLLVSRVLGNMLVNALEASDDGDQIRLSAHVDQDNVRFDVWNRASIPQDIQKRIFQRHFSTKATTGRGLGTYSMKLFGEKYLNGQVGFTSSPEQGTMFTLTLPR